MKSQLVAEERYAGTLFRFAEENRSLPAVRKECLLFDAAFDSEPQLRNRLAHPLLSPKLLGEALLRSLPDFSPETTRFIRFLADRRRLSLLPGIVKKMVLLFELREGIARASVRSAAALTPEHQRRLEQYLQKHYGTKHRITYSVDTELIGGFVVERNGEVLDCSLRHQLYKLKQKLSA